jgi:N utilization substance protein A
MVVSELRGEKIDIIPWNTEPARFVAKALSPARVREVYIDDETKEATVIVPDDQLALAIGKEGLNARLATRLTGWKIDIQSESEFAKAEAEAAFAGDTDGEEYSGRCAAILSNGKRCPNAALPGSPYCGVPAHQALASAAPVPESNGDGAAGVEETPEEAAIEPEAEAAGDVVAEPTAETEIEPQAEVEPQSQVEPVEAELQAAEVDDLAEAPAPEATEAQPDEGELEESIGTAPVGEADEIPAPDESAPERAVEAAAEPAGTTVEEE